MKVKEAAQVLIKARKFVDLVADQCTIDENYFAQGLDGDKWVAWVMMPPGHEVMVYDVVRSSSNQVEKLTEASLDRLLKLSWKAAKPMNPLEALARTAAIGVPSPLGSTTVIDGAGKGITDAPQADAPTGVVSIQGAEDR